MPHHLNRLDTFSRSAPRLMITRRRESWISRVSLRKVLRLAIVVIMSFMCWIGLGCFAFEMFQLAGR